MIQKGPTLYLIILAITVGFSLLVGWLLDPAAFEGYFGARSGVSEAIGMAVLLEWGSVGFAAAFWLLGVLPPRLVFRERLQSDRKEVKYFFLFLGGSAGMAVGYLMSSTLHGVFGGVAFLVGLIGGIRLLVRRS